MYAGEFDGVTDDGGDFKGVGDFLGFGGFGDLGGFGVFFEINEVVRGGLILGDVSLCV